MNIDDIFDNTYVKVIIILVLCLLITFAHEIELFRNGVVAYLILAILAMMMVSGEHTGYIVLLAALFIVSYNNTLKKKDKIT